MPFRIKISLAILLALLGVVLVLPLIVPIAPLEGVVPAAELADDQSRFVEVAGIRLHTKVAGAENGGDAAFVLLHGFGSSVYTWHAVTDALAEHGRVVAFDRPGFGLTERPAAGEWSRGQNPYAPATQVDITLGLMDELGIERAVLIGSSSGAALAAEIAWRAPDRVVGLVLVSPAIYQAGGPPAWTRPLLHTPQMNRVGPALMRTLGGEPGENLVREAWADPERMPASAIEAHRRSTSVEGWDRALWEVSKAARAPAVAGRLGEVSAPTLVLAGAGDEVVPPERSARVAEEIGGARLEMLDDCGHVPQEECPEPWLDAVLSWWRSPPEAAIR